MYCNCLLNVGGVWGDYELYSRFTNKLKLILLCVGVRCLRYETEKTCAPRARYQILMCAGGLRSGLNVWCWRL